MYVAGWLLLGGLTAAAILNALGAAERVSSRPVEAGLAAGLVFFAILSAPVLLLGYAHRLEAPSLALASAVLNGGAFAAVKGKRTMVEHLRRCGRLAVDLTRLPIRAVGLTSRARSFALAAVLAASAMIAYALVVTALVPVSSWDGFLYHEPIVGFALQNHGFEPVHLPSNGAVQATNGYPRLCEALSIWFVIFTDRTLVELPNVLAAPPLVLGAYALCRRQGDRVGSIAWASALVLVPQFWAQLCQVYIDVLVGFFTVAAMYFATRPELRIRDAISAACALALLGGSKFSALSLVPIIGAVAAFRLLRAHLGSRPLATLAALVGSLAVLTLVPGVQLVRNLHDFGDPVWPVSIGRWHGLGSMREYVSDTPLRETLAIAYDTPIAGLGDVILRGYGYALAWVVLPIGLVAVVVLSLASLREAVDGRNYGVTRGLGWLMVLTIAGILTAPTLNGRNARYNFHLVAGVMAALGWATRRPAWLRVREGMIGATVFLSLLPFSFVGTYKWAWGMTDDVASIFLHPWAHHAYVEHPTFDLLGKEREEEVHAGDTVVFDRGIFFVGALWNFRYSNVVRYVHSDTPGQFLERIRVEKPVWVAVGDGDNRKELERRREWELVGTIAGSDDEQVFRRRR
jgi:hypothetical protein